MAVLEIVMDSDLSEEEAKACAPDPLCPKDILFNQVVVQVEYFSFDGRVHRGQIVAHRKLAEDVKTLFKTMFEEKFPIYSAIPVSDKRIKWSDGVSMKLNNTSAFNYRAKAGSDELSTHALGRAIDINPLLNPYIKEDLVLPAGAVYDVGRPGTVTPDGFIVLIMEHLGWTWGGRWTDRKDYQHFEKRLD